MEIPQEIVEEVSNDKSMDWIEKHDRLNVSLNNHLALTNQIQWWKVNCRIRKAFVFIDNEIEKRIENKEKISSKVISWTRVAELANCDRNTVKHPNRIPWTEARRKELLDKINLYLGKNVKDFIVSEGESETEKLVEKLNSDLEKSLKETSNWFLKYEGATDEIKVLNRLLKRKQETIDIRNSEIKELRARLKNMMQHT